MSIFRRKDKEEKAETVERFILSHDTGAEVRLSSRQEKAMRGKIAEQMGLKPHQIPLLFGGLFRGRYLLEK